MSNRFDFASNVRIDAASIEAVGTILKAQAQYGSQSATTALNIQRANAVDAVQR